MTKTQAIRLGLVLLLMFAFGLSATTTAPPGSHIGHMWPVGLASGALTITTRRGAPYVAAIIAILAWATFALAGYPAGVAVGYAIGIAAEALVARLVLTAGKRHWYLLTGNDFGRFLAACALSSTTGAVVFGLTAGATGFGDGREVAFATFMTHLASEMILLALFRRPARRQTGYGNVERFFAWTTTIAVTLVAFTTEDIPSLVFLVFPPLGWVAFRAPMREALLQLLTVGIISSTLSNAGLGPFADPYLLLLDPEFRYLPQQAFLLACAMMTIPFAMSVAMQQESADQALRERARSDHLVRSARGIALIGTDETGRINLYSPSAEAVLGYTPDEAFEMSTWMLHTDAEIARQAALLGTEPDYLAVIKATVALPPGTARNWEVVRKDGVTRTLSTIISPTTDDLGRFTGYVATGDDITDQIDARKALEKALKAERKAVKRLTEIDQIKDAFVSSVSHELRTPITNIVGYLELLQDGVYGTLAPDQSLAMERIDQNSRRLLVLIDDLLTLSSMENMDTRRRSQPVDLVGVVGRSMDVVRPTLLQRDLTFDVSCPASPVPVTGDPSELERLVINLATNAVKFTPDGGRIELRLIAAENGSGPVIEVADTGIGIPEEDSKRLFDRFFRAEDANVSAVPGSGLGLSISKAIVEMHGGTIAAESVYGEGAVFRVSLPAPTQR